MGAPKRWAKQVLAWACVAAAGLPAVLEKKLDVQQFAGIHWGRSTWKDLLTMVVK